MHRTSLALGFLSLLLIPIVAYAATSDDRYRECMRVAVGNRETRIVSATGNYHLNWHNLIEDRRLRYDNAWNVVPDKDRTDIIRRDEKDVSSRLRENDKAYKEELRTITNDYRVEEKRCTDELRIRDKERRSVPVGRKCYGTDECSPPSGICTTEFGDCRSSCIGDVCRCAGVCVLR